jgi:hypothetical protein
MRYIVLGLLVSMLAACGSNPASDIQADNPQPCGANKAAGGMLCLNPTIMTFRTATGMEAVPFSNLTGVDVQAFKNGTTDIDLERRFMGVAAVEIVKQLGLFGPHVGTTTASIDTGLIFVTYLRQSDSSLQTKTLMILNNRVLQDSDFTDTTYNAETTLDRTWLAGQPGQ